MGRRADSNVLEDQADPGTVDVPRPTLPRLFLAFLSLGATAFGGPAMVAHIRDLAVKKRRWLDDETFRNGVALCQTIPGATAMQTSAYVGLRVYGARGAAASFIGFGLPAFLLMLALSVLYAQFHGLPAVVSAFGGLHALIVALIAHAAFTFGRAYLKKWQDFLIVPVAAVLFWMGLSPILVVIASFLLGIALRFREDRAPHAAQAERALFPLKPVILIASITALCLVALFLVNRRLLELSLLMLRVDLFAFGGGFSSIPLMLHEVVETRHWMEPRAFMDGIALGQVTPGPIVITATFVGYAVQAIPGAFVATASIFLPSFFLVISVAPFFLRLNSFPLFRMGIAGILCSFVGLLASTSAKLGLAVTWDLPRIAIAAAAFAALMLKVNLLWVVLGATLLALILRL
ncbi:MAG: chromate efflux transporter [Spirochaetia bacterium]